VSSLVGEEHQQGLVEIVKDGSKVTEESGDVMQKAGMALSASGLPEVGIPLAIMGSGLEAIGTAGNVGIDVQQGNFLNAGLSLLGFFLDKSVSKVVKGVAADQGINEQGKAIIEGQKEVVKEVFGVVNKETEKNQ